MRSEQFPALDFIDSASADFSDAWNACPGKVDAHSIPPRHFASDRSLGALWIDDLGEPHRSMRAADEFSTKSHSPPPRRLHIPLTPNASVPGSIDALLTTALRAEQKASRRAEVRHRRLRKTQSNDGGAPTAQAVLVIEPDDTARDQLCDLLRAFGFAVHAVADPAEASALATSRFFAAIFVDIDAAPPGGDGIDLCKHVREVRQSSDTYASILVLVAARLQPTDRVRAALAGCDETILKPMSRGVVARVLDVRGISLPSDERRV